MAIHHTSLLNSFQEQQIQDLVNICTDFDQTNTSFPFEDVSQFLFAEHDGRIIAAAAFVPVDEKLYECSAFTHPDFRKRGFFSRLLEDGLERLPEDSELIFYADPDHGCAADVLLAIGAEQDSEEHMMKLLPETFSACFSDVKSAKGTLPAQEISLSVSEMDDTAVLCFSSPHAVVYFSVFPSHSYLYGFEVEETCRGTGYGTRFLNTVLSLLLSGQLISESEAAYSSDTVSALKTAVGKPVLLQVAGDNLPALSLYKKTGFQITETLRCYFY